MYGPVLISTMTVVFSNSSQKYPNMKFSLKTQKFFLLSETLIKVDFI